jgi:hypothetical protein
LTVRGLVEKELTRERVGVKRATELVAHRYIDAYIKSTMQVRASRKGHRTKRGLGGRVLEEKEMVKIRV